MVLVGAFLAAAGCGSGRAHNALIGSVSHGSINLPLDDTAGIVGEPIPGAVYQVTSTQVGAPGAATILMQEVSGIWKGASGSIAVNSAVGETVAFAFDGVTMAPQGDGGIGTFSMSGTLTINNVDDVCNCIN